jgi:hypothetical protein
MTRLIKNSLFIILLLAVSNAVYAQKKTRQPQAKKKAETVKVNSAPADTEIEKPVEEQEAVKKGGKKNERPGKQTDSSGDSVQNSGKSASQAKTNAPNYIYEFSQPDFIVSQILIEHDENGKGQISFQKKGLDEKITDPVQLSAATMEKINNALTGLDYFNSGESYQYEKDYPHLGNIKIKVKKDGRETETKFNYTTNPHAKTLADEYRKIGQQFVWIFDINLARENQPLESPRLFDALDSLIRRNEVADASQMVPFLKELSNDERMPLISRNHAAKLVKQIEKNSNKGK